MNYVEGEITEVNLSTTLDAMLGDGDLLIDLAWNIGVEDLLEWFGAATSEYAARSVVALRRSGQCHAEERTLHWRHMALRRQIARWESHDGPGAVVDHGANPGLVSHSTKQALSEIGYPERQRITSDEVRSGRDELGVLVMGHSTKRGGRACKRRSKSSLGGAPPERENDRSRGLDSRAVGWMLASPSEGVRGPDELPWRDVLDVAGPYVGTLWSGPSEGDPVSTHTEWFDRWAGVTR